MTDRQRAFISVLVFTVTNRRFFTWHRVGVKRLPDGAQMYEFNGLLMPNEINLQDDRYNKITDRSYQDNPWVVRVDFVSRRGTDLLKLEMPAGSTDFRGEDGDFFRFEGRYFANSDQIEIRDYSQDKDKYLYRIYW